MPLIVLIATGEKAPSNVSADEWKRYVGEKTQLKANLANLSRNSKLIYAEKSGHEIHFMNLNW